ncbi:MAG: hypothetical protein ACE5I7_18765 [Candidatus Binatia bacterium]
MARPLRVEFPGAFYHVTARRNERKPVHRDAVDRRRAAQRRYAHFLLERHGTVGAPGAAGEGQLLLGARRWVERMRRRVAAGPIAEVTGRTQRGARPSLSVVLAQVCRRAKVDKETLLRRRGTVLAGRGAWR